MKKRRDTELPRGRNVFDFREELARQKRAKRRTAFSLVAGGLLAASVGGAVGVLWPFGSSIAQARPSYSFVVCGAIRQTCVVDGDTIWLEGVKIRIADIDTPEIGTPRCDSEYALGIRARDRLRELLNEGDFAVQPIGSRDEDQHGRKLRVITRGGQSLGDRLVAEGLARTWSGRREPWC